MQGTGKVITRSAHKAAAAPSNSRHPLSLIFCDGHVYGVTANIYLINFWLADRFYPCFILFITTFNYPVMKIWPDYWQQ